MSGINTTIDPSKIPTIKLPESGDVKAFLLQLVDHLKKSSKITNYMVDASVTLSVGTMDASNYSVWTYGMRVNLDGNNLVMVAVPLPPPPKQVINFPVPERPDLLISIAMSPKNPRFTFKSPFTSFTGSTTLKLSTAGLTGAKGGVIYGQLGVDAAIATMVFQKAEFPIIK